MDEHLFIEQMNPIASREDEFNRWHEIHARETVEMIDGFAEGQRYRVDLTQSAEAPAPPWHYLTLYELKGDVNEINEARRDACKSGAYTRSDGLIMDDHVAQVYSTVGERYRLDGWPGRTAATHVLVARTNAGTLGDDAYNRWHDNHVREIVNSIDGYMGVERFKVSPSQTEGTPAPRWQYVALHDIETNDMAAVNRSAAAARSAGAFTANRGEQADDYSVQLFVKVGDRVVGL